LAFPRRWHVRPLGRQWLNRTSAGLPSYLYLGAGQAGFSSEVLDEAKAQVTRIYREIQLGRVLARVSRISVRTAGHQSVDANLDHRRAAVAVLTALRRSRDRYCTGSEEINDGRG
jgi:hypothetical protein